MGTKRDEKLNELNTELQRLLKQIEFSIELITPDIARNYLKSNLSNNNYRNRTVSARAIKNYMKDMVDERWKTISPISFDVEGGLIDGQQRLHAVVKSDTPILSMVIRGLDTDVFDVLDGGKRRTPKDALTALVVVRGGKKNLLAKPAGVSAGINMLHSLKKYNSNIDKNWGLLTNSEIVEIVRNDFDYYNKPFVDGSIAKWKKNIDSGIKDGIFAAFYYKNKKDNDGGVEIFLNNITNVNANVPPVVRKFRDMIIYNKGRKSDERGYLSSTDILKLMEILFKYSKSPTFTTRKHFSKKDLDGLN